MSEPLGRAIGTKLLATALAAAVALSLQAVGLVDPALMIAWGVLAAILAIGALIATRGAVPQFGGVGLLAVGLAVATALQLIPLPVAWLGAASPTALETRTFGLPLSQGGAPLTLDVVATRTELAKLVAYALLAVAAASCVRRSGPRSMLYHGLVWSGVAFAAACVIHSTMAPEKIWGLYQAEHQTWGLVRGPLVNSNHIAGVLAAAAPLTFALALDHTGLRRRLWLGVGAVQLLLTFLTLSRGGAVAALVGMAVFGVRVAKGKRPRVPWGGVPIAVGTAVAVGAALAMAPQRIMAVWERTRSAGLSTEAKVLVWRDTLHLVSDHWLTGAGRGTFAQAFTRYRTVDLPLDTIFHHPENLPLQWAAEWGLPVALLALGALAVWLARVLTGPVSPRRTAAAAGLIALLVQNLADFSLELPAVASFAIVLACLADPRGSREAPQPVGWRTALVPAIVLCGVGLVLPAALGRSIIHHGFRTDGERAARALARAERSPPSTLLDAMARHPADYALPLLLGEWHARRGRPETFRWLNRAVYLNPSGGHVHLAIGRALARGGRKGQAFLELRLAQRAEPARGGEIAGWVAARGRGWPELALYVGTGRGSASRALALSEVLQNAGRRQEQREVCRALSRRSETVIRHLGLACLADAARALEDRPLAVRACRQLARERTTAEIVVEKLVPTLTWAGLREEADRALEDALRREPDSRLLLARAARLAHGRGAGGRALDLARRLERTAGTDAEVLTEALTLQGWALILDGRPRMAIAVCEQALASTPQATEALRCVADGAFDAGDLSRARAVYRELEALGAIDEPGRARLRSLHPSR